MPKGKPKRKTKRKYTKKAQFINENNIKIVVNSEPKKTRRRRRRRPKASIDRVNNLRMNNQLKPLLNNYPLSKQMFHQDKLTTDGLKESNIKTTEALKQLTNFMTTNMGRRKSYPSLEDKEEEYDGSPFVDEIEDNEDMKQLEDGSVDDDEKVPSTSRQSQSKHELEFYPSNNEGVDASIIEAENKWIEISTGKTTRDKMTKFLRKKENSKLRKNLYEKAMVSSSKGRTKKRDEQIMVILEDVPSLKGAHLKKENKK